MVVKGRRIPERVGGIPNQIMVSGPSCTKVGRAAKNDIISELAVGVGARLSQLNSNGEIHKGIVIN